MTIMVDCWQQLKNAAVDDPVQQKLREVITGGWLENRAQAPECVRPYFDMCDKLTIQDELIYKGQQIVAPVAMRKELMEKTHVSHNGIEGCLRRARETLYRLRMTTELREYISNSDVCLSHRNDQGKEPMQSHKFIAHPWTNVATDLCEFESRVLLVVCDYYSNFMEVVYLGSITSQAIIKEMKDIFARFGVPDTLVTENGPQSFQFSPGPGCSRHHRRPILSPMERQRMQFRLLRICLQSARQLEHQSFKHS